jgi:hypothetical protein
MDIILGVAYFIILMLLFYLCYINNEEIEARLKYEKELRDEFFGFNKKDK